MLIPDAFTKYNIRPRGIIHIGAHMCEEREIYNTEAYVPDENILWIDGNPDVVDEVKRTHEGVRIVQGLIADDVKEVSFGVTNNRQSSSFLPLGTHRIHHPDIYETYVIQLYTTTLPRLLEAYGEDIDKYNFLAMDIQGAEFHALMGMMGLLHKFDYIYLEVNDEEVYAGCGLFEQIHALLEFHGFYLVDKVMTSWKWGDALYARPQKADNMYE